MSGYSLVIQVASPTLTTFSPGHVAYAVSAPDGSVTYFGFGPATPGNPYDYGRFDLEVVPPGNSPTIGNDLNPNYSNVFDHSDYKLYSMPISDETAGALLSGINSLSFVNQNYNGYPPVNNVCSTDLNSLFASVGLPSFARGESFSGLSPWLRSAYR